MFCNGKKKTTVRAERGGWGKCWTINHLKYKPFTLAERNAREELRFSAVHTNSFIIKWSMITFTENVLQTEAFKSEVLNISVNSRKGDLWIQLTHINWIPIQSPGRVRINMADGTLGCLFIIFFRKHSRLVECTTAAWIRLVDTKSSSANNNIENLPGVPP